MATVAGVQPAADDNGDKKPHTEEQTAKHGVEEDGSAKRDAQDAAAQEAALAAGNGALSQNAACRVPKIVPAQFVMAYNDLARVAGEEPKL